MSEDDRFLKYFSNFAYASDVNTHKKENNKTCVLKDNFAADEVTGKAKSSSDLRAEQN